MELSTYGLERAKLFSWERSAQKAWNAFDDLIRKERKVKTNQRTLSVGKKKLRIAYVSPLPPQKSGIAEYSADLLPYLTRYVDIDVFVEPGVQIRGFEFRKRY